MKAAINLANEEKAKRDLRIKTEMISLQKFLGKYYQIDKSNPESSGQPV